MQEEIIAIARRVLTEVAHDDLESLTGDQLAGPVLLALANKIGKELARHGDVRSPWPILSKTASISAAAGDEDDWTDVALPADYARLGPGPIWVGQYKAVGPVTAEWEAQYLANPGYYVSPRGWWRIVANVRGEPALRIIPKLTATRTVRFPYVSSFWVRDPDGTLKALIEGDNDRPIFDSLLFQLGLLAEYKEEEELADHQQARIRYEQERNKYLGEDAGNEPIDVGADGYGDEYTPGVSSPIPLLHP